MKCGFWLDQSEYAWSKHADGSRSVHKLWSTIRHYIGADAASGCASTCAAAADAAAGAIAGGYARGWTTFANYFGNYIIFSINERNI